MNAMQKTIEYVLLIHYKLYDKNSVRLLVFAELELHFAAVVENNYLSYVLRSEDIIRLMNYFK